MSDHTSVAEVPEVIGLLEGTAVDVRTVQVGGDLVQLRPGS